MDLFIYGEIVNTRDIISAVIGEPFLTVISVPRPG